jgi:two-component system chemotaxis response regulator CheY
MAKVLSVGQCGMDHALIARRLKSAHAAEVDAARTAEEAVRMLGEASYDLVLVNRVLDHDGSSGLELVRRLKAEVGLGAPVMLVSNYADAQAEAVRLGAAPGFGKSEIGRAEADARIGAALGSPRAS